MVADKKSYLVCLNVFSRLLGAPQSHLFLVTSSPLNSVEKGGKLEVKSDTSIKGS